MQGKGRTVTASGLAAWWGRAGVTACLVIARQGRHAAAAPRLLGSSWGNSIHEMQEIMEEWNKFKKRTFPYCVQRKCLNDFGRRTSLSATDRLLLPTHLDICACVCVLMPYQRVVLCYQDEAIVVDEVTVNVLFNRQDVLEQLWKREDIKIWGPKDANLVVTAYGAFSIQRRTLQDRKNNKHV